MGRAEYSSTLKTTVDAIQSAVDDVDTAVGAIDTAVGNLNTAIDDLANTDVANLAADVAALDPWDDATRKLTHLASYLGVTGSSERQTLSGEHTTASASYAKICELTCLVDGEITVKFDAKHDNMGTNYAKIYKNGVAAGTERTLGTGYVTYSEDFEVSKGDTIEVWGDCYSSTNIYVQNFKLCYDFNVVDVALT